MNLLCYSKLKIECESLPGKSAVIRMGDAPDMLAEIKDERNVVETLDLIFNDASEAFQIVQPPNAEHAEQILEIASRHQRLGTPNLILQCQWGYGRSQAVHAALLKGSGYDADGVIERGTYNRKLYRHILEALGKFPDPEPLVSMAVRVKYNPERLHLFLLAMRRQRYDNWEVIGVTDGPNEPAKRLVESIGDSRIKLIETDRALGRWGHPNRQVGISACKGEWIGLSNDDNYYVPGYFEQMVFAGRNADLVMCALLHSYFAWTVAAPGGDIGCWIARRSLVSQVPWTGINADSEAIYLEELKRLSNGRVATVKKALFVHN